MIPYLISLWSILGCLLNIWKKKSCFVVWSIGNFAWIAFIFATANKSMYGQIVIWIGLTLANIYGYYVWAGEERNAGSKTS